MCRLRPLVLSVAAVSLPAVADHALPEVTVTAAYDSAFSMTPATARQLLEQTPGGVGVVDARDFQNGRTGNMEDTLRLATGVFIASRFGSDEARVSIRGSGLQRTFHGRGLMLLQDGVPLNLADGGFDMQAIEPGATRYIEVQRGANALRYGSSTLGGAINYVSHTGRSAPGVMLRAEAGSFDYRRYQASVGGVSGALDGYASLSHTEQDGFRDHARQRNGRFFGNAGWQLTDRIETRLYATVVDTDSELPGNLSYADLRQNPRQADAASVRRDAKRDFPLYRLASRTAIQHDHGGQTEVTAFAARKQLFHPIAPFQIEQRNRDFGLGVRHEHPAHVAGRRLDTVVGASWHRGLTEDEQFRYAGGFMGAGRDRDTLTQSKDNRTTADNRVLYAEGRLHLTDTTMLSLGGQHTDARRRVVAATPGLSAPGALYDVSYRRFSPKLGVQHQLTETVAAYANVSGSFEPPSFSETLNNQPLKAQRATTYEIGMRGDPSLGGMTLGFDLSYYRSQLKNELLAIEVSPGVAATANADQTRHQGIEAGLRLEAAQWRLLASYLYNDFRFTRGPLRGNRIAGVPDQVLSAELLARLPRGLEAGPTLRAASRSLVDHSNTSAAPGYAVFGVKLHQRLSGGLSWFVEGRNLTDKRYASTTGVVFDTAGNGRNQALFAPGDGRAFTLGLSQTF